VIACIMQFSDGLFGLMLVHWSGRVLAAHYEPVPEVSKIVDIKVRLEGWEVGQLMGGN